MRRFPTAIAVDQEIRAIHRQAEGDDFYFVANALAEWPKWFLENQPSPTGRLTFTTWKHWTKDDPLQESGLLGPVRIPTSVRIPAV